MAQEIQAKDFEKLVLQSKKPVIIDFYSTECPPCEALAPKFEAFYELYHDEVDFYKIYRQGNRELAVQLGVSSSPTLLFFKNGKEISSRLSGGVKKSQIKKALLQDFRLQDRTPSMKRKHSSYDLVIIGAGPAGLTAALYASIAKLNTLVIDQGLPGGQVNLTHLVANYPGTETEINGYMLMHKMSEQAKHAGAHFLSASEITRLDLQKKELDVDDDQTISAKAMILATGARPRPLGVEGEEKLFGKGISYCATCDGKFYEGKSVYVIGGGNSAVEESLYLTQFVKELTIIHQFDEFQANKKAAHEALSNPKIKVLWSHEPRAFMGDKTFEKLEVENLKTGEKKILSDADGVFVFIGYVPQTELFKNQLKLNQWGYIETGETLETEIPGVYAAGDLRAKQYKQITTAVADGTVAALNAEKFIRSH